MMTAAELRCRASLTISRGCTLAPSMVPRNNFWNWIRRWRLSRYRQQNTSYSRSHSCDERKSRVALGLASDGPARRVSDSCRLAISTAACNSANRANPSPRSAQNLCRSAAINLRREWKLLSTLRATSRADCPGVPVRSRMASNSASDNAAAPLSSSFSRGRSSLGQSRIAMRQHDRRGNKSLAAFRWRESSYDYLGSLRVPRAPEAARTARRRREILDHVEAHLNHR